MVLVVDFDSLNSGLRHYEALADLASGEGGPHVEELRLDQLSLCPAVFQPRNTIAISYDSEKHVRELMRAIKEVKSLEPIVVWWGGDGWVVIDGHHRVAAYDRLERSKPIPVVVFEGTPQDALLESIRLNGQNKLPMTTQEKANAALRLCLLTSKSKADIVKATGTSSGTVAEMRRVISELKGQGLTVEEMSTFTWKSLRERLSGPREASGDFSEYTERRAAEIKAGLLDLLHKNPLNDADALALAISEVSYEFARRLMNSEHWPIPWSEPEDDDEEELAEVAY